MSIFEAVGWVLKFLLFLFVLYVSVRVVTRAVIRSLNERKRHGN